MTTSTDLLHRADPVLDVVRRCELVVSYGEHIEGHRFETAAGRTSTEKFGDRGSCRFPADDDAIAGGPDFLDVPAQVGNACAELLEDVSELIAREPFFIGRIGPVVGVAGLREKSGDVLLLRLIQRVLERLDDSFRRLHGQF